MLIYMPGMTQVAVETFNGLAMYINSNDWATTLWIAMVFGIGMLMATWIVKKDLMIFGRFVLIYIIMTTVLFFPTTIHIYDESNPGKTNSVDHVPLGVAFPASLITSIFYAIEVGFEVAFHLPDDLQYTNTGMMFGSNLMFNTMNNANIIDPQAREDFSNYATHCIMPDRQLGLMSWSKIANSPDIFSVLNEHQSPIRGFKYKGKFETCRTIYPQLKAEIKGPQLKQAINHIANKVFGSETPEQSAQAVAKLNSALPNVYSYFVGDNSVSKSASDLILNNMVINSMRHAPNDYSAFNGATAATMNYGWTTQRERLDLSNWNSSHMATYTLPYMQMVLFLFLCVMAPFIFLMMFVPGMSLKAPKNYVGALLWVSSWPIGFILVNFIMTAASKMATGDPNHGVVLSNQDAISHSFSEFAGTAGYLLLAVPFLMTGLTKGMSSVFAGSAQYFGGTQHSIASASASEQQSGNISFGNSGINNLSHDNVSANKFDTNTSLNAGNVSHNTASGSVVTDYRDGGYSVNSSSAVSSMPISMQGSNMVSHSLQNEARTLQQQGMRESQSAAHRYTNSFNDIKSLDNMIQNGKSLNTNWSSEERTAVNDAVRTASSYIDKHGEDKAVSTANQHDSGGAWRSQLGGNASFGAGGGKSEGGKGKPGVSASIGGEASNTTSYSHQNQDRMTTDRSASTSDEKAFSQALDVIQNAGKSINAGQSSSAVNSLLSKASDSLDQAQSYSQQADSDFSKSASFGATASKVNSQSDGYTVNFAPEFQDYLSQHMPESQAKAMMANPNMASDPTTMSYVKDFVQHKAQTLEQQYAQDKATVKNESQAIKSEGNTAVRKEGSIASVTTGHMAQEAELDRRAAGKDVHFDKDQYGRQIQDVKGQMKTNKIVQGSKKDVDQIQQETLKNEANWNVSKGEKNAGRKVFMSGKEAPLSDDTEKD
jgi:conjugal transfer mating pair stabilization protein TraG